MTPAASVLPVAAASCALQTPGLEIERDERRDRHAVEASIPHAAAVAVAGPAVTNELRHHLHAAQAVRSPLPEWFAGSRATHFRDAGGPAQFLRQVSLGAQRRSLARFVNDQVS